MRAAARVVAPIAALIAGCSSDGIYLEVRPPPGVAVSNVELFLALRDCAIVTNDAKQPCQHMQPADFDRPEQAAVYFRQPETLVAELDGGAARFRFAAEDKKLPVVIAVAFDGEAPVAVGTMQDLDLSNDPLHVILELGKAQKLTPASAGGDAAHVAVWSRDRAIKCVGADLPDGGLAFIVPESDPDCDAVAIECDPLGYLATRPGDRICVDTLPAASGPACVLGGTPCREEQLGPAPACVPDFVPDCVPGVVCSCEPTDAACLKGKLEGTGVARVTCKFSSTPNPSNAMERIPCPGGLGAQPAKLDMSTLPFTLKCPQPPELGAIELPLRTAAELTLGDQTIKSTEFAQLPCAVSFEWFGVITAATPIRQDALLSLEVDAGVTVKRSHVVLPLSVTFDGMCAEPQGCTLVAGSEQDTVWACAH